VLLGGAITEGPYPHLRSGNERCNVEGQVDSGWIRVRCRDPRGPGGPLGCDRD
jgi:hypothetical protein